MYSAHSRVSGSSPISIASLKISRFRRLISRSGGRVLGEAHIRAANAAATWITSERAKAPTARERVEHIAVDRWLVAGQRDQLGDVHALVAHALDVLDHVQQRGPVAGRPRRRQRQQGEDALVDLQVAAVDAVVVVDHHLGELHILLVERFQHAVELLDDQVQAAERVRFELGQLRLEVRARVLPGLDLERIGCLRRGALVAASRTCR
jgi:hypothetical protein